MPGSREPRYLTSGTVHSAKQKVQNLVPTNLEQENLFKVDEENSHHCLHLQQLSLLYHLHLYSSLKENYKQMHVSRILLKLLQLWMEMISEIFISDTNSYQGL